MYNHSKIKALREDKKISQKEIAEKINVSLKTYNTIEQGSESIKLAHLIEIAKALEVDVKYFLGNEKYYTPNETSNLTKDNTEEYLNEKTDLIEILKNQISALEKDKAYFMTMLGKCLKGELKELPNVG